MTRSDIDDTPANSKSASSELTSTESTKAEAARAERRETRHDDAPAVEGSQREDVPPVPRKRVFAIAFLVVAGLLAYGGFRHWETYQRATEAQHEALTFTPEVTTITAKSESGPTKLTLPGQTEAFNVATIYPRATGYVAERRVDIGSAVQKGDLLIRIAAPDLDAQLAQAKGQLAQTQAAVGQANAQLAQAKANLQLAQVTSERFQKLTSQGYQTVQNNDNQATQVQAQQAAVDLATSGIKVAEANQQAQQATVERLQALVAFENVVAPFDGVVTTRNVEKGDLVNADSKTATALFTIAYEKVLRVTVHVPQANAFAIKDGLVGTAFLPQRPDKTFRGRIARSSVALLNSARTLDTEVDVENPTGELKPGAYVSVSFEIPRPAPTVVLPAESLIFDQHGLQVAVVQDDQVRLQKISIYRDFGKTFELREGLSGGEQVVINPPIDLRDGQKVKLKAAPPQEQAKQ